MSENKETKLTRRRVLKASGAAVVAGGLATGSVTATPPCDFDYQAVDATNVFDASTPTVRLDNHNGCAAKIKIESTGSLDGNVYTVGANQAGYEPPEGKYIDATCGEVITGLQSKRPSDKEWTDVTFGTATVGGDAC